MTPKRKRRGPGNPGKLTEHVHKTIVDFIRKGNYYSTSCEAVGINYNTFRRWMQWGAEGKSRYVSFYMDVKKAEREAELNLVEKWKSHMNDDWKAVATFLERRHPEKWGRRMNVEQNVKQEVRGQVKVNHSLSQRVIQDPEASELAHQLLERIAQD